MTKTLGFAVLISGIMMAGTAIAQTSPSPSTAPGGAMKMSQADCQAAWSKLDASKTGSVSEAQAQPSIADFKRADLNNDGKLSQAEFQTACDTGLVRSSATTGTGTGTSGSGPTKK